MSLPTGVDLLREMRDLVCDQAEALAAAGQFVEQVGGVAADLIREGHPAGAGLVSALRDLQARTG